MASMKRDRCIAIEPMEPPITSGGPAPWLTLTGLGRIYGISAVHCGRLLSDAGRQGYKQERECNTRNSNGGGSKCRKSTKCV